VKPILNKRWTIEEDKRLLELAATGKPHVAIGAALKRSTVSVSGRLGVLKTYRLSKVREAAEEYAND